MPTRNELIARKIAFGFDCGDCDHDEASKEGCVDMGCVYLRENIEAALNKRDKEHSEGAKPANPEKYPSHQVTGFDCNNTEPFSGSDPSPF